MEEEINNLKEEQFRINETIKADSKEMMQNNAEAKKPQANGRIEEKERDEGQLCDCGVAHKICPVRCLPPSENPHWLAAWWEGVRRNNTALTPATPWNQRASHLLSGATKL